MKKNLLSIICFLVCILTTQAQVLYSFTQGGGSGGAGTISKFIPATNTLIIVKSFKNNDPVDGSTPAGTLLQANNGKLYGMTQSGGSSNAGVIFSFDPSNSSYIKLKDFDGTNGGGTFGNSLIQASDGKLYGMTAGGGSNGAGVIFSFDPTSSAYTKLKDFGGDDGASPLGSLVQASDGKLYGITFGGGNSGFGVIFSYDPSSSTYTKLVDIENVNIAGSRGSLMQASDGKLYGMSYGMDRINAGIIFSFDPSSLIYSGLVSFNFDLNSGSYPGGGYPVADMVQAGDGKLYGMTSGGGTDFQGVIFSYDLSSATYTKLKDFDDSAGLNPLGNLLQASDGKMYGMTHIGGRNLLGTIFSFDPSTSTYTKLLDYDDSNGFEPGFGSGFIEVKECTAKTFFRDADGDGYGNPNVSVQACTQSAGYVTDNTDCDDTKAFVHPGAPEICGNGIDDNCNGQVDEDCNMAPTVSINNVHVSESQRLAVLTVTLSNPAPKPVWLLYYTKDGTAVSRARHKDYEAKFGLLYIPAGALTGNIYIRIIKDRIPEPTEYFDVVLLTSLHATIADHSGRVFISDRKPGTNSKTEFEDRAETTSANSLEIKVMPNPSAFQFNLTVVSNKAGEIDMKVMDAQGRLIETKNNLMPGQTFRIGGNYRPGTYFIQAVQGEQRKTVTLIRLSQ